MSYYYAKGRLIVTLGIACLMVVVGGYFMLHNSSKAGFVGWSFIIMFSVCVALPILGKLFVSSPALSISEEGIQYRPWGAGVIAWTDIQEIEWATLRQGRIKQQVVVVRLKDRLSFLRRLPMKARISAWLDRLFAKEFFVIYDNLDLDLSEVLKHARSYYPDLHYIVSC